MKWLRDVAGVKCCRLGEVDVDVLRSSKIAKYFKCACLTLLLWVAGDAVPCCTLEWHHWHKCVIESIYIGYTYIGDSSHL